MLPYDKENGKKYKEIRFFPVVLSLCDKTHFYGLKPG